MEHLTAETLARLVDESPAPDEATHLASCGMCSRELAALKEQTETLASLPEILPPMGDWDVLEAQLRSEGLMKDPGLVRKLGLARTPAWMPAAAAVVLFLGGAAAGVGFTTRDAASSEGPTVAEASTVEDAATAVRAAEQEYVTAVSHYRELMARDGVDDNTTDPISRYAALEHLVSVSQAAVRQAPGDPFLNGFLASALAERDAAARVVSVSRENWF
jgi:hypothetical protein